MCYIFIYIYQKKTQLLKFDLIAYCELFMSASLLFMSDCDSTTF